MIEEEQVSLQTEKESLVHAVLKAMVPPDPSDSRNSVMEIEAVPAGTKRISLLAIYFECTILRRAHGLASGSDPFKPCGNGRFFAKSFLISVARMPISI